MFKLFFLLFCLGCSDHVISKVVEVETTDTEVGEEILYPDIVVTPDMIDFGNIRAGHEVGKEILVIVNAGQSNLFLTDMGFDGTSGFSFVTPSLSTLLPGESTSVMLEYDPETYEIKSSIFHIDSNDPDEPIVEIPIAGAGDAPVANVTPSSLNYDTVDIGCAETQQLNIKNSGNLDLNVTDIILWVNSPVEYFMSLPFSTPSAIAPGDNVDLDIAFSPKDLGLETALVDVESDDPISPVITTTAIGEGTYHDTVTDSFEQASTSKLDILFVIDDSCSMYTFQNDVASNIGSFMNVFNTLSADYQIGVITTTYTNFSGNTIVKSSDTDPAGNLASIIASIGTSGSGVEKGLHTSYNALQPAASAGPGSVFLRNDAVLSIVYISDEPDSSTQPWSFYTNYIDTLKTDPTKIIAHAVIGDYPSGCTWTNGSYTRNIGFGEGYYEVATYYSGNVYSICAIDWGQQMQSIAQASIPVLAYELSKDHPIEDTISVDVDAVPNTDWSYNSTDNSVEFDISVAPDDGSLIEINYAIYGCTEE